MNANLRKEVEEKAEEFRMFCKENKIPCVICFADVKNKKTDYVASVVTPLQCDIELADDRITPALNMFSRNFRTIPLLGATDDVMDPSDIFNE